MPAEPIKKNYTGLGIAPSSPHEMFYVGKVSWIL